MPGFPGTFKIAIGSWFFRPLLYNCFCQGEVGKLVSPNLPDVFVGVGVQACLILSRMAALALGVGMVFLKGA